MKKTFFACLIALLVFTSCNALKSFVPSSPDWYTSVYQDQMIKIQDADLLVKHSLKLDIEKMEFEQVKGNVFKPVSEILFEKSNTEGSAETKPKANRITLYLSKLAPYEIDKH